MTSRLERYVAPGTEETRPGKYWRHEDIEEHLSLTEYQTILPTFLRLADKGGRILDAGCGLGRWLIYLHRLGYLAHGLDISAEALRAVQSYDRSVSITQGDVQCKPFRDESFDAVICLGVVEHFEAGPGKALRESRRVLKPNGLLFVTVPYDNLLRRLVHRAYMRFTGMRAKSKGLQPVFAEYRFSRKDFVRHVREAGFGVLLVEADDFRPPKSLGLYADWWFLRSSRRRRELNRAGNVLLRVLRLFPLWLYCSGILVVARKESPQ